MDKIDVATAEFVVENLATLVTAPVWLLDPLGRIVASSQGGDNGRPHTNIEAGVAADNVRFVLPGGDAVVLGAVQPDMPTPTADTLARLVTLLVGQAGLVNGVRHSQELRNRFIYRLLHAPPGEETALRREGQMLGLTFAYPRAVLVLDAADYILAPLTGTWSETAESRLNRRTQLTLANINRFFHQPNDALAAYMGDGEVVILKAYNPSPANGNGHESAPHWADLAALKQIGEALLSHLRTELNAYLTLGLGRPWPGLQGLGQSYAEARTVAQLGRRFVGLNHVYSFESLGLAAFVGEAAPALKVELAAHLLAPLAGESALTETLRIFFAADCNPGPTAQRLSIHRNTLSYRLDKIAGLTGLDPRRFDDSFQLRAALMLQGG